MEKLTYEIFIKAPVKTVWKTMLDQQTYRQWVGKSWPNSVYEGAWKQGEKIRFIGPDGSGTLAELQVVQPYEQILAKHVAILLPGGMEDRTSDMAKGWVGITEGYDFMEENGGTRLVVRITTPASWKKMFDDGWPSALEELKHLSEGAAVNA